MVSTIPSARIGNNRSVLLLFSDCSQVSSSRVTSASTAAPAGGCARTDPVSTTTPDFTPYNAVFPEQSLTEKNPMVAQLKGEARKDALASAKMNWDVPDAVPTRRLNAIIWHATMGWDKPLPKVKNSLFAPGDAVMGVGDDDGDTR